MNDSHAGTDVLLVSWGDSTLRPRLIRTCEELGLDLEVEDPRPPAFRTARDAAPRVIIVDLSKRSSHGRKVAKAVQGTIATRDVPLLLVGEGARTAGVTRRDVPGARAFLEAPLDVARLRRLLRDFTEEPDSHSGGGSVCS